MLYLPAFGSPPLRPAHRLVSASFLGAPVALPAASLGEDVSSAAVVGSSCAVGLPWEVGRAKGFGGRLVSLV